MKQPNEKQFSLKPIQEQVVQTLQQQFQSVVSNFMSYLAIENWGYTVTENTRFRIEGGQVYITELPAEGEVVPEVSTGSDTKDKIKG